MGFFRTTIYGIIFGVYAYTSYFDVQHLPRFGLKSWLPKLLMLSILNLILQTIYSATCLICALLDWKSEKNQKKLSKSTKHTPSYWRKSKWHTLCDNLYFISFPIGMATCFLFWGLYAANPEFVMPNYIAKFIPFWYNHATHTAPIIFLLIDTLLTCHHAPSRTNGFVTLASLFFIYVCMIFGVYVFQGYWLYPIFEFLTAEYRIFLCLIGLVLLWLLYIITDGLNTMLWGAATHKQPSHKIN